MRNERFGRGRAGRGRGRGPEDRQRPQPHEGPHGSEGESGYGGFFGGDDYRGMTRGGYPGYGAGDAGWGGGYPGYGEEEGWRGMGREQQEDRRHEFDEDYLYWRNEQLKKFDADYEAWRTERREKFSEEFEKWRSSRPGRTEGSRTTAQSVTKNK